MICHFKAYIAAFDVCALRLLGREGKEADMPISLTGQLLSRVGKAAARIA